MDIDTNLNVNLEDTTRDKLIKLMLAATASLLTGKLIEGAYDVVVKNRRSS